MKTVTLLLLMTFSSTSAMKSQELWGFDVNKLSPIPGWERIDNIYINSNGVPGLFDEVILLPDLGYIFYAASPVPHTYQQVVTELEQKLGSPAFVKDYIAFDIRNANPTDEDFLKSVDDRGTFIYREWNQPDFKIQLYWNSDRFVVECYRR